MIITELSVCTNWWVSIRVMASFPVISMNWRRCIYEMHYYDGPDGTGNSLTSSNAECEDNRIADIYSQLDMQNILIGCIVNFS